MENKSIDDILSNEPDETPAEAPAKEEVTEQIVDQPEAKADGRERDEFGRFKPKEETGVKQETAEQVTAPPADQSNGQLPPQEYAALRAIRDENKELKRRIESFEAALTKPPQAPQQPVGFWDDPDAFLEQRDSKIVDELFQRMEQRQQVQRMEQSEAQAKAKYADYDEAFQAFSQAVQANPRLAHELAQVPDPGEFAYSKGKAALALEKFGSIDDLLKAERAKWEAEVKASMPTLTLPGTTAADGSVGGRSGPEWAGPKPLGQILG